MHATNVAEAIVSLLDLPYNLVNGLTIKLDNSESSKVRLMNLYTSGIQKYSLPNDSLAKQLIDSIIKQLLNILTKASFQV